MAPILHHRMAYLLRGIIVRIGFGFDQLGFACKEHLKTGLLGRDTLRKTFRRRTRAKTTVASRTSSHRTSLYPRVDGSRRKPMNENLKPVLIAGAGPDGHDGSH
jgi:hypothetical protein